MIHLSFNPLHLIFPPILIIFSIPLTVLAILTTFLAVTTLFIQALIVYISLGLTLLRSYILTRTRGSKRHSPPSPLMINTSPSRRRPIQSTDLSSPVSIAPARSDSYASLIGLGLPNRDYEGVGGWRDTNDDPDEAQWIGMNSRLELPAGGSTTYLHSGPAYAGSVYSGYSGSSSPVSIRRHHVRSLTGGSQRTLRDSWFGSGALGMGSSRKLGNASGYGAGSPKETGEEMGYFAQGHRRRKSSSSQSVRKLESRG